MSNFLCDMRAGDEICVQGPFGDFILRPPMRDTIFIATGTGIAPFRSMLHWLLADPSRHQGHQLWLVFGNRSEADIYYDAEFKRMERANAGLRKTNLELGTWSLTLRQPLKTSCQFRFVFRHSALGYAQHHNP